MDLSPKAIRFLIESLKHYEAHMQRQLQADEHASEDEAADLANDRQFAGSLRQDLEEYHHNMMRSVEAASGSK